jgi:tRNA threonylcarbamoyladenosine biosynthesis protein TsaB
LRLLAFDTSGPEISAAAGHRGALLAARRETLTRGHGERLLPLLREVLDLAAWSWRDVELIVVTEGPGNFTGLRAGIAVARGLALALGCPAMGIGTLELAAEAAASAEPGNRLPIQVVLDARRGEAYTQRFAWDLAPLTDPMLAPLVLAAADRPGPCLLVGDGATGLPVEAGHDDRVIEMGLDARYLARAAWRRLAGGAVAGPGTLLRPVYLRQPDARIGAGASLLAARD